MSGTLAMPHAISRLNAERLTCAIFADSQISQNIYADYNIPHDETPAVSAQRIFCIFRRFRNTSIGNGIRHPNTIMKAAFWAIASSQTDWLQLSRHEDRIAGVTTGYCPAKVDAKTIRNATEEPCCAHAGMNGAFHRNLDLAEKCAISIKACPAMGDSLKELHCKLRECLSDHDATLAVAMLLGNEAQTACKQWPPPHPLKTWKLPGMGPTIASEFLRNLGFEAIKPDTHIRHLFRSWRSGFPLQATDRWRRISAYVKSKSIENAEFAQFAIFGQLISPPSHSLTELDNLLWLYAKYYKKKGYLPLEALGSEP